MTTEEGGMPEEREGKDFAKGGEQVEPLDPLDMSDAGLAARRAAEAAGEGLQRLQPPVGTEEGKKKI